jgi:hypothetical protein
LGKTYGIKARHYWEHPWGTQWELKEYIGSRMGIRWEQRKNEKNLPPYSQKKLKRKKVNAL